MRHVCIDRHLQVDLRFGMVGMVSATKGFEQQVGIQSFGQTRQVGVFGDCVLRLNLLFRPHDRFDCASRFTRTFGRFDESL